MHDMAHVDDMHGMHEAHSFYKKFMHACMTDIFMHDMQLSWQKQQGFATWMDEDWIGRVPTLYNISA